MAVPVHDLGADRVADAVRREDRRCSGWYERQEERCVAHGAASVSRAVFGTADAL